MFKLITWPSLEVFRFFRSLRRRGYYEIHSVFAYGKPPREFRFNTMVYFDGDLTNIIPPIDYYRNDQEWYDTYRRFHELHLQKVALFMTDLDRSTHFWGEAMVFPAFVTMNIRLISDLFWFAVTGTATQNLVNWVFDLAILIAAVFLRKYFVGLGIRLLIRIGMWTAQIYKKRKEKKRLKTQQPAPAI